MRYNRISADCHLDLIWLPPDLFVSEAPRELKDRMPYVPAGPDGPRWVASNGATFGLVGGVGASGTKHVPGKQLRVDVMAATGLYEDGKQGIRRPGDPHLRVKEMDRDGVDAEVIYGILAAAAKLNDREASTEMLRIYNTWLADFCRHYPDRHIGLANLPYGDILTALMGRAVFERYPNLRIAFGESGIGWIPYVLDRMDFEYEDQYKDLPLTLKPSEYWRRQCKATFQYDRVGTKLIDEMGVETLMWGSDYPHPDGVWPESTKYISEQFKHLPDDVTRKMTCENAGRFYGLM